ncbi:MAG TPA: YfiR family protein [Prosthecobacter sp.]|nr:YfiR family protein [Prosthecobacter sp.]
MAILRDIAKSFGLPGAAFALLLAALCLAPPAQAQSGRSEYAVKAVFLYNFCQFMDWPRTSFAGPNDAIVIGVLGRNPFGSLLNDAVRNEAVRGRPIRVEYYATASQARCHILFITEVEWRKGVDLSALHERGIATVGESQAFVTSGGMMALVEVDNKVRLRVNLAAVRTTRIEISSKLLRVADINR